MTKKRAGGSGIGTYRRGEVLTDIRGVQPGQLLVLESLLYKATNLIKVTQIFPDKFYALFVDPENPAEKRQSSDEEFKVDVSNLSKGEYYVALEPSPITNIPEAAEPDSGDLIPASDEEVPEVTVGDDIADVEDVKDAKDAPEKEGENIEALDSKKSDLLTNVTSPSEQRYQRQRTPLRRRMEQQIPDLDEDVEVEELTVANKLNKEGNIAIQDWIEQNRHNTKLLALYQDYSDEVAAMGGILASFEEWATAYYEEMGMDTKAHENMVEASKKTAENNFELNYENIKDILEEKLEDGFEHIVSEYELQEPNSAEVEHEFVPGFIPHTNGGWSVDSFTPWDYLISSGKGLPVESAQKELDDMKEQAYSEAISAFKEEYPDIFEELGEDNIDYNTLIEKGYSDEAEWLSEAENEWLNESAVFRLAGYYYEPDNSHNETPGKHAIYLFYIINMESPYHRTKYDHTVIEEDITFDTLEELSSKMDAFLVKVEAGEKTTPSTQSSKRKGSKKVADYNEWLRNNKQGLQEVYTEIVNDSEQIGETPLTFEEFTQTYYDSDYMVEEDMTLASKKVAESDSYDAGAFVANLGAVHPLTHGGFLIYDDGSVVYWDAPRDDDGAEPKSEDSIYQVYQFIMEKDVIADLSWVDDKDLEQIGASIGETAESLREQGKSEDIVERANVYREVGGYYGMENVGGDPTDYTYEEMIKYFGKDIGETASKKVAMEPVHNRKPHQQKIWSEKAAWPREKVMQGIKYIMGEDFFVKPSEEFSPDYLGGIWSSGESLGKDDKMIGTPGKINPEIQAMLDEAGWFMEWYDSGTPMIYEASKKTAEQFKHWIVVSPNMEGNDKTVAVGFTEESSAEDFQENLDNLTDYQVVNHSFYGFGSRVDIQDYAGSDVMIFYAGRESQDDLSKKVYKYLYKNASKKTAVDVMGEPAGGGFTPDVINSPPDANPTTEDEPTHTTYSRYEEEPEFKDFDEFKKESAYIEVRLVDGAFELIAYDGEEDISDTVIEEYPEYDAYRIQGSKTWKLRADLDTVDSFNDVPDENQKDSILPGSLATIGAELLTNTEDIETIKASMPGGEGDDGSAYNLLDGTQYDQSKLDNSEASLVVEEYLEAKATSLASLNDFMGFIGDAYGVPAEATASFKGAWHTEDSVALVNAVKKHATRNDFIN